LAPKRSTFVRTWTFILFAAFTSSLSGQDLSLEAWAALLKSGHSRLAAAQSDDERIALHDSLIGWWTLALDQGLGRAPELADLDGTLALPEAGRGTEWIRVISWNVELNDRTQRYGGFILPSDGKGGYEVVPLVHNLRADSWTNMGRCDVDHWPGAIYYDVLLTTHRKSPTYTLLGWDGGDALVTRKMVEPISVRRGRVRFGHRIIIGEEGLVNRLVLEYADDAVVTVRYEEQRDRIVLDHLSPTAPHLKGSTAFYGPDMTYDALVWSKGNWILKPNVDVADPKIRAPYNPPPQLRRRRG
jgi:hypothetical protein